jgi:hypothetical protein
MSRAVMKETKNKRYKNNGNVNDSDNIDYSKVIIPKICIVCGKKFAGTTDDGETFCVQHRKPENQRYEYNPCRENNYGYNSYNSTPLITNPTIRKVINGILALLVLGGFALFCIGMIIVWLLFGAL